MSLDPATRRTLRRLARTRGRDDLARLFAAIRRHDDETLMAALAGEAPAAPPPQDFARAIAARLAPVVAPAAEKADMLIEALAATHGPVPVAVDGLLPTVRKLARRYGEAAVDAAADAILARAEAWGAARDRVK